MSGWQQSTAHRATCLRWAGLTCAPLMRIYCHRRMLAPPTRWPPFPLFSLSSTSPIIISISTTSLSDSSTHPSPTPSDAMMSTPPSPVAVASSSSADAVTVAAVPTASLAPSSDPPLPPPRKFPAPCWTQEETMALINAYKDKWYALRCRNLRSADWDSVASDLFNRCPPSAPPASGGEIASSTAVAKTSAQCRHKMEKLRKRYRTEKQRALAHPNRFFASSWLFYDLMDAMETGSCLNGGSGPNLGNQKGFGVKVVKKDVSDEKGFDSGKIDAKFKLSLVGSEDNSPGDLSVVPIKFKFKSHGSSLGYEDASRFDRHLDAEEEQRYGGYEPPRSGGFFERKISGRSDDGGSYYDSRFEPRIPNGIPGSGFSKKSRVNKRPGMAMEDLPDVPNPDPNTVMSEMVRSIRMMGEGFVKMEKMKVDMVRDIERMRMEMEMKRSEMILESQQLIVNAFVEGLLGSRKKNKKMKLVDQ